MNDKRAVFLDRDGTLCRDVGYPARAAQVHIYPFAYEAVRTIQAAGLAAVVITDQSGIGRGFFGEAELRSLHREFSAAFERRRAPLDRIYHCPHYAAAGACDCAKPHPGLAARAAADLGLRLEGSYMIGDKAVDIAFGLNIGAVPVLVLTGYGRETLRNLETAGVRPAHIAADLAAAVDWIIEREGRGAGPAADRS
jgi:D-glycero-D-manno-heptose 1,7-bisphosphate phosphatase